MSVVVNGEDVCRVLIGLISIVFASTFSSTAAFYKMNINVGIVVFVSMVVVVCFLLFFNEVVMIGMIW